MYNDLSEMLRSGSYKSQTVKKYPELSDALEQELAFFHNQFKGSSIDEYRKVFVNMVPEVRRMFPEVERLLRLLLISPASSCEAERSFSALRRMKTWLRSTMTQKRLNHLMICNVHRERLAALDPQDIAAKFVKNVLDTRGNIFGNF